MFIGYRLEAGPSSGELLSPNQRMPWWKRMRLCLRSMLSSGQVGGKGLPPPRLPVAVPVDQPFEEKNEDPILLVARALAELLGNQFACAETNITQFLPHDANLVKQFEFKSSKKLSLTGECLLAIHTTSHLRHVRHLDLSNNQLKSLPSNLSQHLPRLQTLNLQENQLTSLPSDMRAWSKSLSVLKLDRNSFVQLPSSISHLTSLRQLSVARNPLLMSLKADNFESLNLLEVLDLSHNARLHPIPYALIRDHPNLRSIKVDGCVRMFEVFEQRVIVPPKVISTVPTRLTWLCWQAVQPASLPSHARSLLTQCLRCDWCRGPMMAKSVVYRYRSVLRLERFIIVEYSLCCAHWNTEVEYMEALLSCQ